MRSATKPATALSPNISCPTHATNVTLPPARAAPTAWLAPLPPAALANFPPRIVSPGLGMCCTLMIMSVLELPTTRMGFLVIADNWLSLSAAVALAGGSKFRGDQNSQTQQVEAEHGG